MTLGALILLTQYLCDELQDNDIFRFLGTNALGTPGVLLGFASDAKTLSRMHKTNKVIQNSPDYIKQSSVNGYEYYISTFEKNDFQTTRAGIKYMQNVKDISIDHDFGKVTKYEKVERYKRDDNHLGDIQIGK